MTTPHERLAWALAAVLAAGDRPPCCDGSGAWVSEDRDERALAARACMPCPIRAECAAAADDTREVWGVWGGTDRAPRPPRRGAGGSHTQSIHAEGHPLPADLPTAHTKGLIP